MDLYKILKLISLLQLKSVSKTDRTGFAQWHQLPVPFAWILQFQMLSSSSSSRNEWLQSPPLHFQLLRKNTWKGEHESLNEKRDGRNTQHLPLRIARSFSFFFQHVGSELTTVQHWEAGHGLPCLRDHLSSCQAALSNCTSINPQAYLIDCSSSWKAAHTLTSIGLVPVPIGEDMAGVRSFRNFAGYSKNNCTSLNKWLSFQLLKKKFLLTKYQRSRCLCCWWKVGHVSYCNSLHSLLRIPPWL